MPRLSFKPGLIFHLQHSEHSEHYQLTEIDYPLRLQTFIQRICSAIQLVTKGDDTLAVAMLQQKIGSDIRRYFAEV
ncbi:hypothetical protein BB561_000708 [Smittium simulii]|uniref:Uncharacterized protein n=1 Tax=Smittium simulii TaxID=133385 RepID=A0A2T9YXZ0_9FUNG|nr:hypothetical protein BB561_000708 [Smittium simulii]